MRITQQKCLFDIGEESRGVPDGASTTFTDNLRLPVHRWFRYSAGFSARWAEEVIADSARRGETRVLDPFAGSATTLLAAEEVGVSSFGIEAHPFIARVGRAKLLRRSSVEDYRRFALGVLKASKQVNPMIERYPALIQKCYRPDALCGLDQLRRAYEARADSSAASELTWLTLVGILRAVSHVGTAQWQYVLPRKTKKNRVDPFAAFRTQVDAVSRDMASASAPSGSAAELIRGDARTCEGVPDGFATLVVTSPPYTNNYDYADATRLEMTFMGEIAGWGDLQAAVRKHLVRSCSQHVPESDINLSRILRSEALEPIRNELAEVCAKLGEIRKTRGGKKTYHLMIACYFMDMAQVWHSLRRVCARPSRVCFVVGDSAPYGVYVPVERWLGTLALACGFDAFEFEKTRDRNTKWKNRKHRVPLHEGRLWVRG